MPPATSQHPTEQTLIAYGLGKIDDAAAAGVVKHLEGCAACKGRVAELSADSFVGRLRGANRSAGSVAGASAVGPAARGVTAPDPAAIPAELLALTQYSGLKELGRGGMGVVYLARNVKMDRLEVLKVVQRSSLERAGSGAVERFLREIQSAARLQHPNVVGAYAVLEPGDLLVFAMEYAPGHDLAQVVKLKGPLPVPVACSYVQSAAMGLQHAHEAKMVHRDIKPGNLILTRINGKPAVKVLDFGLAKVTTGDQASGELTGDGKMMGTPDYMAPEQAVDASRADIRADIYSLGCTLYYLLAGRSPFGGGTLMQVIDRHRFTEATPLNLVQPAVPVELAAAVAKMMAKDPAKRYATPLEVAKAVRPFVTQPATPPVAPPVSKPSPADTSRPAATAPERHSPVAAPADAEAADWGTMTATAPTAKRTATAFRPPARRPRWVWPAVACGLVALGLAAAASFSGVFVKTPDGTIVLEDLPADATVEIDGAVVTVTRTGDKATLTARPGKHSLKVTQGGKDLLTNDAVVTVGGKSFTAKVEPAKPTPKPAEVPKSKPVPVPTPVEPTKPGAPTPTVAAAKPLPPIGQLLKNPGCEEPIAAGIPGWETVAGQWQARTADPAPAEGAAYFSPGDSPEAELRQDVDVTPWAAELDAGRLLIRVGAKHRGHPLLLAGDDTGAVKLEFLGAARQPLAGGFDSGPLHSPNDWQRVAGEVRPPSGTRWVRVRLLASRTAPIGINTDAYFDDVSLTGVRDAAAADGFVTMFNGKDLTGWRMSTDQDGGGNIADGVLTLMSASKACWFSTKRSDYTDYHLRAEVRSSDNLNRKLHFRTAENSGPFGSYLFDLGGDTNERTTRLLGEPRIRPTGNRNEDTQDGLVVLTKATLNALPLNRWCQLELMTKGDTFTLRVDGEVVSEFRDSNRKFPKGEIRFGFYGGKFEIRKIDIREITANIIDDKRKSPGAIQELDLTTHPAAGALLKTAVASPQKLEAITPPKDLTQWGDAAKPSGTWKLEPEDVLVGSGGGGMTFPRGLALTDFYLKFEASVAPDSHGGVVLRRRVRPLPVERGTVHTGYYVPIVTSNPARIGTITRWRNIREDTELSPSAVKEPVPEKWYSFEIVAVGNKIAVFVDGKFASFWTEPTDNPAMLYKEGVPTFRVERGTVKFRKVEYKELNAGGKPLAVAPAVKPAPAPAGPDTRVQWEHSSGTGATAYKGVFQRVGEKTWCESETRPKSQELYWFTETKRTPGYVQLERPNGSGPKLLVRLESDRCDVGDTEVSLARVYTGSWSTKAGLKPTLDSKQLSGWRFGLPKQVEVGEEGLLLTAKAGENSLLTARDDFANMEIRASISASKGTEALLVFRASNSDGWKAIASRVFDKDDKILAGMQSNLILEERGMKRERTDFDRPFDLTGTLKDKVLWMKINTITTSGVEYGGSRYLPASGSGGFAVKSGSITIRSLVIEDIGK